jgi:hypothetical protein
LKGARLPVEWRDLRTRDMPKHRGASNRPNYAARIKVNLLQHDPGERDMQVRSRKFSETQPAGSRESLLPNTAKDNPCLPYQSLISSSLALETLVTDPETADVA